jgi:hypothetical protein
MHVEDEGLHSEWIPGAFNSSIEIRRTEKLEHVLEATFFIGPVENGVQDYGVWKESTKLDSLVGPDCMKIEELDMEDI